MNFVTGGAKLLAIKRTLMALAALLTIAGPTQAHLRDYLVTRPYWTPQKGGVEAEVYNDFKNTDNNSTVFTNQIELEYGLTSRLALGIYAVSEKEGSRPLEYARTKIEGRYRLAEPGRLAMDPAIYAEYKLGANGRPDEIETKLLLSKDFGPGQIMNITVNGIFEKSREPGSRWEKGFALGLSRVLSFRTTAGIELTNVENKTYAIPGVYVRIGTGKRLNIGAAFGLSDAADDFQLRTILEIESF